MKNFRSVLLRGAFNTSRARAIWYDGLLKVFDTHGLMWSAPSKEPQRRPGHIRVWDAETTEGNIVMRGKCLTCGGSQWRRVTSAPAQTLWDLPAI